MVLEVNTSRLKGTIKKKASVISNDPKRPNLSLQLKALVKKSIDISPKNFVKFNIEKGEKRSWEFKIRSDKKKDFQILKIESPFKTVNTAYKLQSGKEGPGGGNVYNLTLTISPETPIGNIRGPVKIHTDIPGISPATIALMGKVEGPIRHHPEGLTFPPVIKGAQISLSVDFYKTEGEGFQIKRVETGHPDLEWKLFPAKNGRGHVLLLTWEGGKTKNMLRGKIKAFTDYEEQARIEIPYTIFSSSARRGR